MTNSGIKARSTASMVKTKGGREYMDKSRAWGRSLKYH